MKEVVTAAEMKSIDSYTIHKLGIPSIVLMERAALAAAEHIKNNILKSDRILCVCGGGNNGGDSAAVARILFSQGYQAAFYMAAEQEKWTEETKKQILIARNIGVPEYNELDLVHIKVVVDGFFGIGLLSSVRPPYDGYIEKINQWRAEKPERRVWAVDIPSGIDSDRGQVMGCAVKADATVTFGFKKRGMILYPGRELTGTCYVADIGFPDVSVKNNPPEAFTYHVQDFKQLPCRKNDSNKGSYGKILIIGGRRNMSGAPFFAGMGAYCTGAGLVRILTDEANRVILQTQLPQALISVWEETDVPELEALTDWADSLAAGPGIGTDGKMAERMAEVLKRVQKPLVLDADALNLLAGHREWYDLLPKNTIITPHMGEMSRLTGAPIEAIKKDRPGWACKMASEHGLICVLKDSSTVVSDGRRVYLNESGNQGMATGGSGDVLTGIIAALTAGGMTAFEAACMGVYLHGCGGDEASARYSARGMTAMELAEGLRSVFEKTEMRNRGCDKRE